MPKFAIGDTVKKDEREKGVVLAIFTTNEGQHRYAVESEGTLQFVLETRLVAHQTKH